jgi:hypothetical protein
MFNKAKIEFEEVLKFNSNNLYAKNQLKLLKNKLDDASSISKQNDLLVDKSFDSKQ